MKCLHIVHKLQSVFKGTAFAIAGAGLNDAFPQFRADDDWIGPLTNVSFTGGTYDVTVTGTLPNRAIVSTGTSSQGFVARVAADITVDTSDSSNHTIRIDSLRINE